MHIASKMKCWMGMITIEPINLLFLVGSLSVEPVRQDFFLQTICQHNFANDSRAVCGNITNSSKYNQTAKDTIESQTALYITIWFVCRSLVFMHIHIYIYSQIYVYIYSVHALNFLQVTIKQESIDFNKCNMQISYIV